MRERIEYIAVVFAMAGLCLLISCAQADKQASMDMASSAKEVNINLEKNAEDELTHSFMAVDSISLASKKAFKERAVQKLNDFYAYLAVAADSSYDLFFRKKAADQAILLMTDKSNQIIIDGQKLSIDELSQQLISGKAMFEEQAQHVQLKDSIVYFRKEKFYKGSLSYILFNKELTTEFYIQKVKKAFGSEKKEVWEVLLGDTK